MRKRTAKLLLGTGLLGVTAVMALYLCRVPLAERLASAALNRQVNIDGIELEPGFRTTITARGIRIANARWVRAEEPLADIGALTVTIDLPASLLQRHTELPLVAIADGTLRLAFDSARGANFAGMIAPHEPASAARRAPRIGRLVLDALRFSLAAPDAALDLAGTIEARDGSAGGLAVAANGNGVLRGREVTFMLAVGGLDAWQDRTAGYPLRASLESGDTVIDIDGTIAAPLAFSAYRFDIRLAGPDTATLGVFTSLPLPDLPPYDVTARIYDDGDSVIAFERLAGRFGDSDLAGRGRYDFGAARPHLDADLYSRRLDLDDLAGLLGAPPDSGPGETAAPADRAADARRDARATVLPRTPLQIAQLRRADVRLHYRADAIDTPHVPLADLDVAVVLEAGRLALQPLRVTLGGGRLAAGFTLDQNAAVTLAGELEQVSLKALLRDLELTNEAAGTLSGRFGLAGSGHSLADWLGGLDGDIELLTAGGQFDSVMTELLGLDAGEALVAHLSNSQRVTIRCGAIVAHAKNGRLNLRTFLIDTSDSVIRGSGFIALDDERYAIQLKAKAKDLSLFSGDAPVYVKGTFRRPEVSPDIAETVLSLLTPIEFGDARNIDCAALLPERSARKPRGARDESLAAASAAQ